LYADETIRGDDSMERQAVVAGSFYPASVSEINAMMKEFVDREAGKETCIAVVVPHAGYVYSGRVAGATYSRVEIPRKTIILAPNHSGMGRVISLYPGDAWHTPLGRVQVDKSMNRSLLESCDFIEEDERAHLREHSAEVHLPFLQYLRPNVTISVMVIATQDYDILSSVGSALVSVVRSSEEPVLIVASSDMTHFESQKVAAQQDKLAISKIEALDPRGLLETVVSRGITMCGVAPVTAALVAALELGATSAELVMYETSGDVTGDTSSVVGYAGAIIK
jgi:AmmeMemoRadiSam system protein B